MIGTKPATMKAVAGQWTVLGVTMAMMAMMMMSSPSQTLLPTVSAAHHDKTLLETNALGYTKSRPNDVAYSENYEVDKEVKGECVNGPPPGGKLAPDAQTTKYDSKCQALGACHIGFTEVRYADLMLLDITRRMWKGRDNKDISLLFLRSWLLYPIVTPPLSLS